VGVVLLCKVCHKKTQMKPNSFLPFGCVAADQIWAACCNRFEHYFWYKLIPVLWLPLF
jgi:hypothetical protein